MLDLRPVGHVIGLLVAALGVSMLLPLVVDLAHGNAHWPAFLQSAVLTSMFGALMALASASGVSPRLSLQQTFLLTNGVWLVLPLFGALPFVVGTTGARFVDAYFEAMSGMTTTGATVFAGLDALPEGLLFWRSMMQWFGGIGIIVVAMVFLPELRIGGMQVFRSEAFDTMGKILPRAAEIAGRISAIYLGLTAACALAYTVAGLDAFDAVNHAMTTLATGGFSTRDASFGAFRGAPEYVAALFMILGSLPFVRYVQLVGGAPQPLWRDSQVRVFLAIIATVTLVLALFRIGANGARAETALRDGLFNTVSIITGSGFTTSDYQIWGPFPAVVIFFLGMIGGCAGSTTCSVKVFRYQILFSAIGARIRRIHSPHGIFVPRFQGRPVPPDVLSSVMAFLVMFVVTIGILSVLLGMTGLDFVTALSSAASAVGNIGPGLGETVGPVGNYSTLSDAAKWLLSLGMFLGRLELLVVFAILMPRFWYA